MLWHSGWTHTALEYEEVEEQKYTETKAWERDLIELLLRDCLVINTQKNFRIHTIAIESSSRDYLLLSNKRGDEKVPPIVTRKNDTPICPFANVRYLCRPGELEGGGKKWATGPMGAQC